MQILRHVIISRYSEYVPIAGYPCLCEQPPLVSDDSDQTIIVSEATLIGNYLFIYFVSSLVHASFLFCLNI